MPEAKRRAVADALARSERLSLACHVNPDGDALGSMLGLGLALQMLGKQVVFLCQDPVPEAFAFLPGADRVTLQPPPAWVPDTTVGLDCDTEARLGSAAPFILGAPTVIDIDHHTGSGPFGHIRLLEPGSSSTSQQVFELLEVMGVRPDRDIATCLLSGIMFDTGAFRFSNTTPTTFAAGAKLVEAGARPNHIAREMFENRPMSGLKLLARALQGARVEDGIVWSTLTRRDFAETGAEEAETDGIINNLMAVRDVTAAALLRETSQGVKASLRSRPPIDVAEVARTFGGGGHVRAAGCTIDKPVAEAAEDVLSLLREQASRHGSSERRRSG